MIHSATLGFRRIICVRCGDRRIVGVVCPTCGEEPDSREVDPDRQRRARLARAALEVLDDAVLVPSLEQLSLAPLIWARTRSVFDDLLGAVMAATANSGEEQRLMSAIGAFRQLEADLATSPRLRPWIDFWTAADDVIARLKSIVRHYLLGSAADTPLVAQREARIAQLELDAAGVPAAALSGRMQAWARVEAAETIEDAISVLAENAFQRSEAGNLLEFDRSGWAVLERVTGKATSLPGSGIGLNLIAEQARGRTMNHESGGSLRSRSPC